MNDETYDFDDTQWVYLEDELESCNKNSRNETHVQKESFDSILSGEIANSKIDDFHNSDLNDWFFINEYRGTKFNE